MERITDLANYFEPETYTLENLPSVIRARNFLYNLAHPMGLDIEVKPWRGGVDLECRIYLLPVRQNRQFFREMENEMIRRAYLGPQEGQNSVIGEWGGLTIRLFGHDNSDVSGNDVWIEWVHPMGPYIQRIINYDGIDTVIENMFREAQDAGLVN